jgi:hypothetical protein
MDLHLVVAIVPLYLLDYRSNKCLDITDNMDTI